MKSATAPGLLTTGCLAAMLGTQAIAQETSSSGHSAQYIADRDAAYETCMAQYKETDEQKAAREKACEDNGTTPCLAPVTIGNFGVASNLCTYNAEATAARMEQARNLAASTGVKGPVLPDVNGSPTTLKLPTPGKPEIKAPTSLPDAIKPKTGLTLSVPVKITNFHQSWNGETLTPEGASMFVVCRVFLDPISIPPVLETGSTALPEIPEGGSLDATVTVNVDANISAVGGPDGKNVECALMRSNDHSSITGNWALNESPDLACGKWTEDKATCSQIVRSTAP